MTLTGKRTVGGSSAASERSGSALWKARLWWATKWSLVVGLVLVLIGAAGFAFLYRSIDIPNPNSDFQTETSFVYYDDGKSELGRFATQNRESISLDEMPDQLQDAVVAAENRTFWTDSGIDPRGILRAAFSNASGNETQGASTITQQYVKILYLTQERSYTRKIKEAILSLKVQRELSKSQVLEGYLNTIYFGRGAYGVQAAAAAFFDKPAKKLNLRQSAVLASVLNNPGRLDPKNGKDARQDLKARYSVVLDGMAELEDITAEEADEAAQKLPKFPKIAAQSAYGGQRGHMLDMVKDELLRLGFTDDEIDGGGLRVTTTLTQRAMNAAEQGVIEGRPEGFGDKQLHIGVASVEPGTGALRGFYGGQDYLDSQLNWAVAGGQAGSTFKPFALAAALDQGFSLRDTFDGNSPYELPDGTDVENQGNDSFGSVDLIKATESSINTAFIDMTLGMDDGPQSIIDMANEMGIPPAEKRKKTVAFPNSSPGLEPNTGVALGSQTVSPINMANGYATIANGGVAAEPYLIEKVVDRSGETRYTHKVETERAISADIAADVSYAMQQVGAAESAASTLGRPVAGKTGTATKDDDAISSAWFGGFTPQLSTMVMYVRGQGNEQLKGFLPSFFGSDFPAATWTEVMSRDMEGLDVEEFPEPVFVDGDAPGDDEEYSPPPPPPPSSNPSTQQPTKEPTKQPTKEPTKEPTETPSPEPTEPSPSPSNCGLLSPCPTNEPSPSQPTGSPSNNADGNGSRNSGPRGASENGTSATNRRR